MNRFMFNIFEKEREATGYILSFYFKVYVQIGMTIDYIQ